MPLAARSRFHIRKRRKGNLIAEQMKKARDGETVRLQQLVQGREVRGIAAEPFDDTRHARIEQGRSAALIAAGSLSTLAMQGLRPAGAAGEGSHPRIVRIPLDTPLSERAVYPAGIAVANFDGAYTMATMYKSGVFAGNKVAFWGSEAGALKAGNYPLDEFVYVLEGDLVTTDADGTRHEFHPGDALVIPKGWVGTWDMKTRFKKIIVNF